MSEIFEDADKTLAYIKERSDDFDKAVIFGPGMIFHWTDGSKPDKKMDFYGMYFHFVGGRMELIGKAVAERVLNDGILNRMKIPIEFATESKPS